MNIENPLWRSLSDVANAHIGGWTESYTNETTGKVLRIR